MTIAELIAALEQATGPSRELDAAIYCAINPGCIVQQNEEWEPEVYRKGDYGPVNPMPYTASIDAALTLVPDGWNRRLSETDSRMWWAELRQGYETSYNRVAIGQSNTAACAMCVAALRAHPGPDEGK